MLNKGDPCYVRLHTGSIVKAKYDEQSNLHKAHRVYISGDRFDYALASKDKPYNSQWCRFVCMSGMRKEYVDSINN